MNPLRARSVRPAARRPPRAGAAANELATNELATSESGTAAVEMALVLPIFLLLISGVIELCHYVYTEIAIADAAREGARYAIVRGAGSPQPASTTDIANYVKSRMAMIDPTQAAVAVSYAPNNSAGSTVQVQVSYPFSPFMPGFNYLPASTLTSFSQLVIAQ